MLNKTKSSILELSYPSTKEEREQIYKNLKELGFNEQESFFLNNKYFSKWAGSPKERLNNFYSAWNSSSNFLIASKGGSGISHFFQKINFNKLKKKKLFCGYSDLTLLLLQIHKKLRIITLHGPNASKGLDEISINCLRNAINMENYGIIFNQGQILNKSFKTIEGKTIGGNLSRLMEYLIFEKINFRNKIVFLEDINETNFKLFNKLTNLKNYPNFKPKAIIFGNLGIEFDSNFKRMVYSIFPKIPIIYKLSFGHQSPNLTIPLGVKTKIDFKKNKILFKFSNKQRKYSIKL